MSEFVRHLDKHHSPLFDDPVHIKGEKDGVPVDLSLRYNDSYGETLLTFVNNINTIEGGTHLAGFKSALTRTLNKYAAKNIKNKKGESPTFGGEDVREGLTAILSIKVPEPQFEGQTKTKLGNGEIKGICDSIISESLTDFFEQNPNTAKTIIQKAENFSAADAFINYYKLSELKRKVKPILTSVKMLCVPSIPTFYSVNELIDDPITPNSNLGTYTNFVNLLDMCGITVPTDPRKDGRPGSITLLGMSGDDNIVASTAMLFEKNCNRFLGGTKFELENTNDLKENQNYYIYIEICLHMFTPFERWGHVFTYVDICFLFYI